tara:strand:- start:175 stop:957 length:783 start_codon:yes stop_codon:yes gene_type:complete
MSFSAFSNSTVAVAGTSSVNSFGSISSVLSDSTVAVAGTSAVNSASLDSISYVHSDSVDTISALSSPSISPQFAFDEDSDFKNSKKESDRNGVSLGMRDSYYFRDDNGKLNDFISLLHFAKRSLSNEPVVLDFFYKSFLVQVKTKLDEVKKNDEVTKKVSSFNFTNDEVETYSLLMFVTSLAEFDIPDKDVLDFNRLEKFLAFVLKFVLNVDSNDSNNMRRILAGGCFACNDQNQLVDSKHRQRMEYHEKVARDYFANNT